MPINEHSYLRAIAEHRPADLLTDLPDDLLDLWYDDYLKVHGQSEMVTVKLDENGSSFTYLFDILGQRNVAVVGIPAFVKHKRDASRMAGHPLSQGKTYHRGHLMAHSIGGGADINLVPQLGSLNIGAFRRMERSVRKMAEQNVRCLYFVRTIYPVGPSKDPTQLPSFIEQGIVNPTGLLTYALHPNT